MRGSNAPRRPRTLKEPSMPAPDKSKPVLITGCSTGIGRETAKQLAGKGWNVVATARKLDAIEDLKDAGCKTTGARRHRREVDGQRGRRSRGDRRRRSARWSTTPATARAARSRRSRWTAFAASSRPTSSAWCACASWCCPACARRARAASSTSARWAASSSSPAGAPTTRPSTRSRRSRTRCGSRSQDFGVGVVIIEPGLIITEFGETAHASIDDERGDRPLRQVQQDGREGDRRRSTRAR